MPGKDRRCQACGSPVGHDDAIGRRDACDPCGAELHACVQCRFYDLSASNQCREPQAERVGDKVRSNFCDLFQLSSAEVVAKSDPAAEARAKLEALFKR